MGIFDKHAPLKFKVVTANNNPFMTKDLRKAIMKRSKLKNEFNKRRSYNSERAYKKQRNLCTYLLRKKKKNYYSNLDPSCTSDTKRFCTYLLRKEKKNYYSNLNPSCTSDNKRLFTYLLRKEKNNYSSNLDPSCTSDNKRFWSMVKPLFTDKVRTMEQITLIENDEII